MRFSALVGEVMKKEIKKIDMNEPIEKAAQIMRNERIGSVVVTGERSIKGIITTSDIVYKYVASKIGHTVKDIMSTDLVTIEPSRTIEEAANLMVKNNIEKILVFDGGRIVGIITNNDILRVEPALYEILLERMGMTAAERCESCGSDAAVCVNGRFLCRVCR